MPTELEPNPKPRVSGDSRASGPNEGVDLRDAGRDGGATPRDAAVIIPVSFATTVAMWGVGYVSHLEFLSAPKLALITLAVVHVLGARAAARRAARSIRAGVLTGGLVSILNLLVLASFLAEGGEQSRGAVLGSAVGFVVLGGVLGAIGALVAPRGEARLAFHPERAFSRVAVLATFLLIVIGGIVTTHEAGLAVPDWPTSFEANMFLLPFSRMVSESHVYYEHAHRLFGALVGVTTVTLALFLGLRDRRRWIRVLAAAATALVALQGWMGGLRVTAADNVNNVENWQSLALRVAHGVTAQVFLALLVVIAVAYSRTWQRGGTSATTRFRAERILATLLVGGIFLQLLLGALVRHISREAWVLPHIGGAIIVTGFAVLVSVRATSFHEKVTPVRLSGLALVFVVILQVFLGFFALAFPQDTTPMSGTTSALESLVVTSHQATGAIVLAVAVLHACRVWRVLRPGDDDASASVPAAA